MQTEAAKTNSLLDREESFLARQTARRIGLSEGDAERLSQAVLPQDLQAPLDALRDVRCFLVGVSIGEIPVEAAIERLRSNLQLIEEASYRLLLCGARG